MPCVRKHTVIPSIWTKHLTSPFLPSHHANQPTVGRADARSLEGCLCQLCLSEGCREGSWLAAKKKWITQTQRWDGKINLANSHWGTLRIFWSYCSSSQSLTLTTYEGLGLQAYLLLGTSSQLVGVGRERSQLVTPLWSSVGFRILPTSCLMLT